MTTNTGGVIEEGPGGDGQGVMEELIKQTNKQKKQKQRKSNERSSEGKMAIQEIERGRSRQALE